MDRRTPQKQKQPEPIPALETAGGRSHSQLPHRTSEEEPEWDVSSAFVANAASHIKLKTLKSRTISRENKENEARSTQVESTEEMKRKGESLTVQGIQMFGQALYSRAVDMFTEAIYCDPNDHRFYGNRSYCYWCLEQFSSALSDAWRSIQLAPDWPKGYFRKGCALMGLKRYIEAEVAMEQELGFEEDQSKELLEKFTTVQAVTTSPEAQTLKQQSQQDQSGSCHSLWVGNVTVEVTEKDLLDLFKM
ncbi:hypothetical protein F7725_006138 [Dissostichus mawsoni]|uniref:Uncharacterized protein n=1 Tax=Dissostichus mawsoni TaxID=36200 RepID=A0A7J5YUB5_DISMA|nr:hypothetical protein F7725_006138 [Dissostichus mawsoni]